MRLAAQQTNLYRMLLQIIVQTLFVGAAAIITLCYMGKGRLIQRRALELIHGKPGCMPVADVGNVTLHYFASGGRAEVIRMLMEDTDLLYKETGYTKTTWPTIKKQRTKDGLFTFGQVPAIVTGSGEGLVQAQAIVHYLGRATGLDCDCEDYTTCEMLALGVSDVRQKLSSMLHDTSHTMADRAHYFATVMPVWLGYFEKLAPSLANQHAAFFVGGRLTWVDFWIFELIDYNVRYGQFDFGDKTKRVDILNAFPKLNNFYKVMASRPNLAKYLNSETRYAFVPLNLPRDAPKVA